MNINDHCELFNVLLYLGTCHKSEVNCGNGFCISRHLECNGYNKCRRTSMRLVISSRNNHDNRLKFVYDWFRDSNYQLDLPSTT